MSALALRHSVRYVTSSDYGFVDPLNLVAEVLCLLGGKCYLIPFHPENGILEVVGVPVLQKGGLRTNSTPLPPPHPTKLTTITLRKAEGANFISKPLYHLDSPHAGL